MIQESVYSKIAVNSSAADVIKKDLREHRPSSGNIQILSVSERQYQDIEFLVGEARKEIVDTMDRFLILWYSHITHSMNRLYWTIALSNNLYSRILQIWAGWLESFIHNLKGWMEASQ